MSKTIDINHVKDIENFPWHLNVSIEAKTITYKNITFEHPVILAGANSLTYNNKQFKYNNSIPNNKREMPINENSINFENCTFSKLTIKSTSEEVQKIDIINGTIDELTIIDCDIHGKFYINKQYDKNENNINIIKLVIKDTVFHENFKLHNANVTEVTIEDTDFKKHADFFKSTFDKGTLENNISEKTKKDGIVFKAINFKGLALFGDTEFKEKLIFKYVTFESFSHFRKAKLKKGLDLDYSNIQQEMNFFDVQELNNQEAKNNTSQETFRIIKHNFEKIGNKIEANKYHALELERKQNTLESEKPRKWLEYIVFKIHSLSSEHSTNWFRVILWLLIIGSITTLLNISVLFLLSLPIFYIIYLLTLLVSSIETERIAVITIILVCMVIFKIDSLFTNLAIITLSNSSVVFIGELHEKLSTWEKVVLFFNKISLGYLYYQFLLSVRKDTRK